MERKGRRAENDFADKSSTQLNLCWHRKKPHTSEKSCFSSLLLHYLFFFLLLLQNTYKYAALLEASSLKMKCTFQRLCTV